MNGEKPRQVLQDISESVQTAEIENVLKQQSIESYNPQKHENVTRESLARVFVYSFFAILFLIIIGVPLYNFLIFKETDSETLKLNLEDLLLTYSSIVGPILGFVVGYYFKSRSES